MGSDFFTGSNAKTQYPQAIFGGILPQRKLLVKTVLPAATELFKSVPEEFLTTPRQFTEGLPGLTPSEQMSLAGIENLASGGGLLETGANTLQEIANRGPADFEQFFKEGVIDPALLSFERDISPAIRRQSAGTGNLFGSGQEKAQGRANEDLLRLLTEERGRRTIENEQLRLAAAQGIPGQVSAQNAALSALQLPRAVETAQRNARLEEFIRQINDLYTRMGFTTNLATAQTRQILPGFAQSGQPSQAADLFARQMESQNQLIGSILGGSGGGGGGGIAGGFFGGGA